MGAKVVKKYVARSVDTKYDATCAKQKNYHPIKVKKETIDFRRKVKSKVSTILKDLGGRDDVSCQICIDPNKNLDNILNVLGTFQKDIKEIKSALGGQPIHVENQRSFSYKNSLIVLLVSNISKRSICVAMLVEHEISKNHTVWEIIWFSTKDRKRNQQYGQLLFKKIIEFACVLKINKILVTATSSSVCWWYYTSCKISKTKCLFEGNCIISKLNHSDIYQALMKFTITEEDSNLYEGKKRRKQRGKIQKEFSNKFTIYTKPSNQQKIYIYYNDSTPSFGGLPYRYSVYRTFHLWFSIRS